MAELKNYLLVHTQLERPVVYIATQRELLELAQKAVNSDWHVWIFPIELAVSQSPNPFGGALLKEPLHLSPSNLVESHIHQFCHNLQGKTRAEWIQLANQAKDYISDFVMRCMPSAEEEAQVEVVEIKREVGDYAD